MSFTISGSFKNIKAFLKKMQLGEPFEILNSYAIEGVAALQAHTPVDSGITANSWSYEIKDDGTNLQIIWTNDNVNDGDRVEIYRPLIADPKELRRQRAEKAANEKAASKS